MVTGAPLGLQDGLILGNTDGCFVGSTLGIIDDVTPGAIDGAIEGIIAFGVSVGTPLGLHDGLTLGNTTTDGDSVCIMLGHSVGTTLGDIDGSSMGILEESAGFSNGTSVGLFCNPPPSMIPPTVGTFVTIRLSLPMVGDGAIVGLDEIPKSGGILLGGIV